MLGIDIVLLSFAYHDDPVIVPNSRNVPAGNRTEPAPPFQRIPVSFPKKKQEKGCEETKQCYGAVFFITLPLYFFRPEVSLAHVCALAWAHHVCRP